MKRILSVLGLVTLVSGAVFAATQGLNNITINVSMADTTSSLTASSATVNGNMTITGILYNTALETSSATQNVRLNDLETSSVSWTTDNKNQHTRLGNFDTSSVTWTASFPKITNLETSSVTANAAMRLDRLETSSTTNTTRITNLETSSATNTTRIANLETSSTTNTTRIANLETSSATNSTRIANLELSSTTNSSRIANLETSSTTNSTRIANIETSSTTWSSEIITLKSGKAALAGATFTGQIVLYTRSEQQSKDLAPTGVGALIYDTDNFQLIIGTGTGVGAWGKVADGTLPTGW